MKKTLIAMAVSSVIAAPVMADVSISGKVEQGFQSTDSETAGNDQMQGYDDAVLVFKASEDLGNGMSAFAEHRIDVESAATIGLNDYKVGISGDFGTVVAGRMENFTEAKVQGLVDVFKGPEGVEVDATADRADNGVAYVTPAMSGLTLGVAGYVVDTAGVSDQDTFDATDIALMYSAGPITVNVSNESMNAEAADFLAAGESTTSVGVKYSAGNLSVAGVWQDREDVDNSAADDHQDVSIAGVYTMGNNSIALGWNEDELTDGTTDNNKTIVEFRHAFSGRTAAYLGATSDSNNTSSTETDSWYVGMEHSF